MSWVLGLLIALFCLDALRLRGRFVALAVLPSAVPGPREAAELNHGGTEATEPNEPNTTEAAPSEPAIVAAPGVVLDDETRRAASAYARAQGLDMLDLVPARLDTLRLLALAQLADTPRYRQDPLARGRTAGQAVLVSATLRDRLGAELQAPENSVAFTRLAVRLKHHAPFASDLAVAPGLVPIAEDAKQRGALLDELLGSAKPFALAAQGITFLILILGVALPGARILGLVALGVFHLQPILAIAGTRLAPPDLLRVSLLRLPWEVVQWVQTLRGPWRLPGEPDQVAEARPVYRELLAGDPARFFAPRRDTCPVCESPDLRVRLRATDLIQHKPGRFVLERCRACGHIFQNPHLSLEGLAFYYRDFYDGLGERWMDFMFSASADPYHQRARLAREHANPKRWLDVGAGHGHFCIAARLVLPDTRFDGLDISESVDEAAHRGWIATGYRGLFPDLAPSLAGVYDAVSMSHYLEHTLDPRAELRAAATALAPGGVLLIEVPDPESALGRLLGRYWVPWFQPQHQHLLSVKNLERLLRQTGFGPLAWHRGQAHQRVDFFFAVYLFLERLAPLNDWPWRAPATPARRALRGLVWTVGTPFMLLARLADWALAPLVVRLGLSNTYRVLARREDAAEAPK